MDNDLDPGEYLRVQAYGDGGSTWSTIFDWRRDQHDDDLWHKETHDLASYLASGDFKVRLVARASEPTEEIMVDDVRVTGSVPRHVPPSSYPSEDLYVWSEARRIGSEGNPAHRPFNDSASFASHSVGSPLRPRR